MPRRLFALLLLGGLPAVTLSDEGMWLPTAPPREVVKAKYGFDLSDAFVQKAMKASIRFSGSSGGFVSPDGLCVTNHHVGADAIQKLSTPERDLMRDGFYAKTRADELKCPDLELNVLQSVEDVTARVEQAVFLASENKPGAIGPAAARRAVLADIEKESLAKTGLRSDVVTLYQGGLYHLYRSKKYTDVRLVFCPESAVAAFGGDVDNFEYPRHSLDVAFFRAYENGEPAKTPDHFKWSTAGPKAGDLVFVTGHPGATQRLETVAKLKHRRDMTLPYGLARARALEAALIQYGEESPEQKRQAATDLHRVANTRKQLVGQHDGLNDRLILATKEGQEAELRRAYTETRSPYSPGFLLPPGSLDPWQEVERAQTTFTAFEREYLLFERGDALASDLYLVARHLVRLADELPKPNPERLREYRDSALDSLKQQLFSPAPLYPPLEQRKLQTSLAFAAEQLGGDHLAVLKALGGRSPSKQAAALAQGSKLYDVAERKRLFDGGKAAVEASADPLVLLARRLDPDARRLRKRFDEEVDEPERQGFAAIAGVRFRTLGQGVPPDATNTFRVAFGTVKGYDDAPPMTTLAGVFDRSVRLGGGEPFALPKRWLDGKGKLDLSVPYNFASTADTIGGNSGSPVLNTAGELVGVNFDRNRPGLVRNFVYTDVQARHVAVHSRAVLETLSKLYGGDALVAELTGR